MAFILEPVWSHLAHTKVKKAKFLAADKIIKRQAEMMTFLQDQLAWAQDKQT